MVVWYTIVDVFALNGFVVWIETHPEWVKPKCNVMRAIYLKTLGMELIRPHIEAHSTNGLTSLSDIIRVMEAVIGAPIPSSQVSQRSRESEERGRGRCRTCVLDSKGTGYTKSKANANKTTQRCSTCSHYVCGKHSETVKICHQCNDASDTE